MNGTVAELFVTRARERRHAPLLVDALTGLERSYEETLDRARRWLAYFQGEGLAPGGRVATCLPNSLELAEVYLAAALGGLTLCPYNPALTDAEVCTAVRQYGATLLFGPASRQTVLAAGLPEVRVRTLSSRAESPVEGFPLLGVDPVAVRPETPLALIMTSGTTGGSKACRVSQGNVHWTSAQAAAAFRLTEASRYLTPLPFFHINAQVIGLLAAMQAGGAVIVGSRLPGTKLWEAAARCRATGMSSVPALVHDLLAAAGAPPPSLGFVVCSSAPLPRHLHDAFEQRFGLPLLFCYGLSEAGCFVSYGDRGGQTPRGSVGKPRGCEVDIELSPGSEPGAPGHVRVRGPGIFQGYDGDAEATSRTLVDGWLLTGDEGYLDPEGNLVIQGRRKEMINRGGDKISPHAVEAVLSQCPGVAEVIVFGAPDARLGEEVAAVIVAASEAVPTDDDLWDFCTGRLADFETPKRWHRLSELPRGPTGKVLRYVLQKQLTAEGA